MSVDQLADRGPGRDAESAELDVLRQQVRRQAGELERLRRRLSDLQRQVREHGVGRFTADDGA
jgi:hypothetical protein